MTLFISGRCCEEAADISACVNGTVQPAHWCHCLAGKPKTYFMYHQFNIQKFCVLLTKPLCVLCGSQNKERLLL